MRSCQISVSPKFNDWYPFKESYLERETQSRDNTDGRRPCDDRGRNWSDADARQKHQYLLVTTTG